MIKFRCGHCGQKLGVPDEYSGRQVRCTNCDEPSTVPVSGEFEDSGVAMILDPLVEDDAEGELKLREEEPQPEVWSKIGMGALEDRMGAVRARAMGRDPGEEEDVDDGMERGNLGVAIGCSAAAALMAMGLWVAVYGNLPIWYLMALELLVPLAAAAALGAMARRSGALMGLLAVAIGLLVVLGGKYVLAKRFMAPAMMRELNRTAGDQWKGMLRARTVRDKSAIYKMGAAIRLGGQGVIDPNCADMIAMACAANIRYDLPMPASDGELGGEMEKVEAYVAEWPEKERREFVINSWYRVYKRYLKMFVLTEDGRRWFMRDAWKMTLSFFDVILLPFACFVSYRLCCKEGLDFN